MCFTKKDINSIIIKTRKNRDAVYITDVKELKISIARMCKIM